MVNANVWGIQHNDHFYTHTVFIQQIFTYGSTVIEKYVYEQRNSKIGLRLKIDGYFRHRPNDLLVINLKEKDSYKRFCDFLGIEQKKINLPGKIKPMQYKINAT